MPNLKQLAQEIFQETLEAIDIPATMQRKLHREGTLLQSDTFTIDLQPFHHVHVISIGKAAHAMLDGLLPLLPWSLPFTGVVSTPTAPVQPLAGIIYFQGGHPLPNADSFRAAQAILNLLQSCDERTLVFFLISGGGSAMVEWPLDPTQTLEDVQKLYRALVTCGAPIGSIGTVRRHVSAVKGGRLAAAAGRATKITLAVTDVPAGQEAALASGPTIPDPTMLSDVHAVFAEFALREKLPAVMLHWIDSGKMPETPKPGEAAFANAHFQLLLGMDDLFHAAHHRAEAKGFATCCDNSTDDWPVEKAADFLLAQLQDWQRANPGQPVALIADGEVSSPVTGEGIGGRNSAFVLSCVEKIAGKNIAVLSAGTDGIDGNSIAAGAVADGETLERARAAGIEPRDAFHRSDAYSFFSRLDDAIVTGPTGNNLRDLRILLAEPQK